MSVAQAPRSTATRKQRKPDPQLVYQTFCYERSRKAWGAYTRTAQAHGLSDDTVKRIVDRFEQPDPTPPEVQYQPAPGQVEYEVKREQQAREMVSTMPPITTEPFAYVAPHPAELSQATDDDERKFVMSNTLKAERETRKFADSYRQECSQIPQVNSFAFRTSELGEAPQNGPQMPQLARGIQDPFPPTPDPDPTAPSPDPRPPLPMPAPVPPIERGISLHADYARRRSAPSRLTLPSVDWGQLVAYAGPVLLLAFLLYQIVLSAAR